MAITTWVGHLPTKLTSKGIGESKGGFSDAIVRHCKMRPDESISCLSFISISLIFKMSKKSNANEHVPTVAINNVPFTSTIPLTTEEPVRRPWLKTELEELNNDAETYPEDENIADEGDDTSDASDTADSDEDSITGQNKIKNIIAAEKEDENDAEKSVVDKQKSPKEEEFSGGDIMAYLSREMTDYQEKQDNMTNEYEKKLLRAKTEDDLLQESDPDLSRRTESNRHIPYEEIVKPLQRSNTIHSQSDQTHRDLLVFSENPTVIEEPTKLSVVQYYGAGKSGVLPAAYRSKRKPKSYLVACDFSKESLYAIEWTMGTMMRDGDELHVATVANRDDNPDIVKATGLDSTGEVSTDRNVDGFVYLYTLQYILLVACDFKCSNHRN